jgi:EAL domain-containing protein (putative c-di-GMP-specific phosphodiesterase class I)/PAS domain-containing protein
MPSRRSLRIVVSVVLSATLAAMLIATIHFTRFDLQWLAFLGGVLFAAALALVSQASKAEWLLLRRSKQLARAREQLSQEISRSRNAAHAIQAVEKRLRLLSDYLPIPVLYLDRDERCRYHNQAFAESSGLSAEKIDGRLLHEIFGATAYSMAAPHVKRTLDGETVEYELMWPGGSGPPTKVKVRQFPYAPDDSQYIGFYLMLATPAAEPAVPDQATGSLRRAALASGESRETLYLRAITEELMDGVDPCATLERALERNEFLLLAQKILALRSGATEPDCYEILLRLREEEEQMRPPGGFFPVAESYGMLEELDRWVVRSLIAWCLNKRQSNPGWRIPLFSINLSAASVTSREFVSFVCGELKRADFPARAICFEISESDAIKHSDSVRRFVAELRRAGCRFSIDGFGGTNVSFSYLEELTVDFLKIDGSIIQNILRDPTELAKTRAINTVCQKAGTRTIAEFVETKETLDKLREIGVDYVQGFGIARPVPIDALTA